ncbi:hypothetical protein J6Z37_02130 [Candidatus Saccharibacteria bacterium]|nr:hypothetical protein [Candidatus Saccharibacteria bacterium]
MTGASLGYDGYYNGTTLTQANRLGAWWAATIYGSNFSYRLHVDLNNTINPQGNSNKYIGRAVHCIYMDWHANTWRHNAE